MKLPFFQVIIYFIFLTNLFGVRPYFKCEKPLGRCNGKGEQVDPSGSKYIGDFVNDKRHGFGVMEYYTGAKFEGQWVKGKKIFGTYYFANGGRYTGGWKNGKQDGEGLFINENGVEEKQVWSEGKLLNDVEKDGLLEKNNLTQSKKLSDRKLDFSQSKTYPNKELKKNITQIIESGDSLYSLKKYDDAEIFFNELIKLDPLNFDAYVRLGNVLYDKNLYDDSKKRYEKAIELNPNSSGALNGLGNISYQNSDFQIAIDFYQQAHELNTSSDIIVDNLANVFDLIGEKYKAVEYYEKLVSLNENDLQSKYWLGEAYRTRNKTRAIKIFEEILEKMQDGKEIYSIENREKDFAIISFEGLEKSRKKYNYDKEWIHNKLWRLGAKEAKYVDNHNREENLSEIDSDILDAKNSTFQNAISKVDKNSIPEKIKSPIFRLEKKVNKILISWEAIPAGMVKYKIFRNGGNWIDVGKEEPLGLFDAVPPGIEYCYTMTVVDTANRESSKAEIQCAKGLFAPPNNFEGKLNGNQAQLKWELSYPIPEIADNLEINASGYRLFRNGKLILDTEDAIQFLDTNLDYGSKYIYEICSYDKDGEEGPRVSLQLNTE